MEYIGWVLDKCYLSVFFFFKFVCGLQVVPNVRYKFGILGKFSK